MPGSIPRLPAFDDQCREAFLAYQRILRGTLLTLMSYGESPMAAEVEPQWHERILHATLRQDSFNLTGVDCLPEDFEKPQGFLVTLTVAGVDQGLNIFQALAERGRMVMPFAPTFWSPGFGVLVDRFGIPWEINTDPRVGP